MFVLVLAPIPLVIGNTGLQTARDRQDRPSLDQIIAGLAGHRGQAAE